jgi:hypothetical protein
MKKSILTIALLSSLAFVVPTVAQENEWKELSGMAFNAIDDDENGGITSTEFSSFGDDVFVSMDYDGSKSLSHGEFYNWGFGMHNAAEDANRKYAFKTAMGVVYSLWDLNADNLITEDEYRKSLDFEFLRADLDQNKTLTSEEYLAGFSIVVAARAAINPQPTNQ